jgi:signal-transduction protein with cAMP-binding, CBS, and nucleotidyltransferase domain
VTLSLCHQTGVPATLVHMKVRDVMVKPPITLPIGATIEQAARAMDVGAVGAVVIVEGDRPVGLVTDRDLVVRALARRMPPDGRVDAVMSAGVVCVDADAELARVTAILGAHPFRRVPVVDNDRMIGMVSLDDLVVRLAGDLYELTKGVTAQLLFGHAEPQLPAPA